VDVRERINVPEIVPRDIPCDIMAGKDTASSTDDRKEGIELAAQGIL
jgi:hypothetical protein